MNTPTPSDQVVFRSDMQTASQKPMDYFAEQNQAQAQKQAQQKKTVRRSVLIIGILLLLLLVIIGVVVWLVMSKSGAGLDGASDTVMESGSTEEVNHLADLASEAYDATLTTNEAGESVLTGNLEAATQVFTSALDNTKNEPYVDQIRLSAMWFYYNNGFYDELMKFTKEVDPESLTTDQKVLYYNLAYIAYTKMGDEVKGQEYLNLAIKYNFSEE